MQQLHLVGVTTDNGHLIFSTRKGAKSGGFLVPLDEQLVQTLGDALERRKDAGDDVDVPEILASEPPAPRPERPQSLLTPREIQARLRAGRTVAQVAREAAVGEDWIGRFAAPVLAEQRRIVDAVLDRVYDKPRRGPSAEPLRLAVRWNLADRGIRLTDDEYSDRWSAFNVTASRWGLVFEFVSRKRVHRAEWEIELTDGVLLARNRLASDLGYVEPGRRRRPVLTPAPGAAPAPAGEPDGAAPARATRTRRATTKRPAGAKKAAPAKKTAAKNAGPTKKATTKKATTKKATTKKA
ncbi:MAG TPA: septation protein SepH, partial [Acidimicrobiales bacterium]|nr:septation protein SepH [Acidimicrobiales bacterium]